MRYKRVSGPETPCRLTWEGSVKQCSRNQPAATRNQLFCDASNKGQCSRTTRSWSGEMTLGRLTRLLSEERVERVNRLMIRWAIILVLTTVGTVPAWADYDAGLGAWNAGRLAEAFQQWQAAADTGDAQAMLALGRLYLKGEGAPQDYVLAHMWFNLAASKGARGATSEREALTSKMTRAERVEAQKRARDWRPKQSRSVKIQPTEARHRDAARTGSPPGSPPERAVREAQRLLVALGYNPGAADGKWGQRTASAYRSFLQDVGRPAARKLTPEGLRALRGVATKQRTVVKPVRSSTKPTPRLLLQAVRAGDINRTKAALNAGVDPNARDDSGWTPLMHAANKGETALISILLDAKAGLDTRAPDGATALFIAALRGHEESVKTLVRAGADTSIAGPRGKTALDMARLQDLQKTVELLKMARSDRADFASAQKAGTANAYERYLNLHRDGLFVAQATRLRNESLDRETFEFAKKANTAKAHRDYQAAHPHGKFRGQSEELAIALDNEEFKRAEKIGSAASYGIYVASNPDGIFIDEATMHRDTLRDRDTFQQAKARHTIQSYETYLRNPKGKYRVEAAAAIMDLREPIVFAEAKAKNTVASYNAYLAMYLDGKHSEEARRLRDRIDVVGREFRDCDGCPKMVVVPPGSFIMGSDDGETDEQPAHQVTISEPIAVGKYEITVAEFELFVQETDHEMSSKPGFLGLPGPEACQSPRIFQTGSQVSWKSPDYGQELNWPVVCTNWNDASAFVTWLATKTGKSYRLLSEAEWEYAARATTTTAFHFGETVSAQHANYNGSHDSFLSTSQTYRKKALRIGSFEPNRFGLHDMHGNVTEWVEDCWNENYEYAPVDGQAWLESPDCSVRVARGGSWFNPAAYLRSAFRNGMETHRRNTHVGFRVARTINPGVVLLELTSARARDTGK